jgi:hypothetical protein
MNVNAREFASVPIILNTENAHNSFQTDLQPYQTPIDPFSSSSLNLWTKASEKTLHCIFGEGMRDWEESLDQGHSGVV